METNTQIIKKIAFATMEKFDNREINSVGSSRIRARWLINDWPEAEEYIIGKKYDVLVFQKVYWSAMMKAFEGIKILDLCDPDWLENKPVFQYVDMADAIVTSTQALADYIKKLRPNALVKYIADRVYLPEATPVHTKHEGQLKKLVWFGYSHNVHYLTNTYDEIIKRGIELTAISNAPIEPPLMYRGKINIVNVVYNYDTVNREMVKADAVLMPEPSGDEKAKFKSNNKTVQAWALRMPVIKTPEDLDKFTNAEEREKEAEEKRQEVEKNWDSKLSVQEYRDLILEIKGRKTKNGTN